MSDEQAQQIIEQLNIIINLLRQSSDSELQSPVLFRDAWPSIAAQYPIPARIGNAIKWELLRTSEPYVKKYTYLTMEKFMYGLRLGHIDVQGLGPMYASMLLRILEDGK